MLDPYVTQLVIPACVVVTDEQHFIAAYRDIQRDIERFAMFLERDRDRAADLVQDALVSGFRAWQSIGSACALRAYCTTAILRMHRRDLHRRSRTQSDHLEELVAQGDLSADELADVRLIQAAIAQLPDTLRIPVVLAEIEQWKLEDIANELQISLSAVKMRVKRGRDMLLHVFKEPTPTSLEDSNVP